MNRTPKRLRQNKANFSIADCGLATDLRRADRLCETNPIRAVLRLATWTRGTNEANRDRDQVWGQGSASGRQRPEPAHLNFCAKQTHLERGRPQW